MFISQGSLLDQTNLSQQTSALSGFCAHINATCFQCYRYLVPQQDLLYLSKDMLTFLIRSRKHLENSMQVTIFFPSSCSRTNTKYYWMYDWFPWRLSVIALHTDEILSLVLFNCRIYFPKQGAYYIYMALPMFNLQGAHISILLSLFTPIHRSWGASHW